MKVESQIEKEEPSLWGFFKSLPMKSFFKKLTIMLVLLFFSVAGRTPGGDPINAQPIELLSNSYSYSYSHLIKSRAHAQLVNEVKRIAYGIVPETQLDLEYLVELCEKYEMDIIFVLAQGILESHLGTRGKAAKTHSVWNVGTYDDGKILYMYDHPDSSIEPYLKLLKERYLVDQDLHNLVQDRGYINDEGYRFASAKNYENSLRKLMVRIDMESSIKMYQDIRSLSDDEILAFFGPPTDISMQQLQAMNY